jgi:hypothetical protein
MTDNSGTTADEQSNRIGALAALDRAIDSQYRGRPDTALNAMPLTLQAGESDFGWRSVPDVGVVEALSGELGAAGSFGDAGVGTESSGRVGALEDFCEGVAEIGGESVRGKNPPAR